MLVKLTRTAPLILWLMAATPSLYTGIAIPNYGFILVSDCRNRLTEAARPSGLLKPCSVGVTSTLLCVIVSECSAILAPRIELDRIALHILADYLVPPSSRNKDDWRTIHANTHHFVDKDRMRLGSLPLGTLEDRVCVALAFSVITTAIRAH
ncbi:hypothetical protein C7476_108158 [Phyllobacterium bourgognense]|uniref:Uncharacterized protein n=1 Tax=Phyllobacterium bourgognense TaxID=314236 RepID=A0A368YVX2_9HYPH|nr:hypothetical protein C7476_108158 [Phyllobacterium bourgognense]